jgi:hypothetical protein
MATVRFSVGTLYDAVIMATDVAVTLRQGSGGRWRASSDRFAGVTAGTKEACLRKIRESSRIRSRALVVEVIPHLVGVAEAARILGWDKRRVATYIQRGSFPEPVESLAGGRIWAVDDIVDFARAFRSRQKKRASQRTRR